MCVFEKPLDTPVKRWNVFGSKFLFMENDQIITVVHCGQQREDSKVVNYLIESSSESSPRDNDQRSISDKQDDVFTDPNELQPERSIGLYKDKLVIFTR